MSEWVYYDQHTCSFILIGGGTKTKHIVMIEADFNLLPLIVQFSIDCGIEIANAQCGRESRFEGSSVCIKHICKNIRVFVRSIWASHYGIFSFFFLSQRCWTHTATCTAIVQSTNETSPTAKIHNNNKTTRRNIYEQKKIMHIKLEKKAESKKRKKEEQKKKQHNEKHHWKTSET